MTRGDVGWYDQVTKQVTCVPCHDLIPDTPESLQDAGQGEVAEALSAIPSSVPPIEAPAEQIHPNQDSVPAFDAGVGGAGARHEYERRKAKDDAALAQRHAFWRAANRFFYPDGKQTTHAWKVGAEGEERLAATLAKSQEAGQGFALHDRRIPKTRANIDHLFVGAAGVFVIDAKHFSGAEISIERVGGLFGPRTELLKVNGRERKALLEGLHRQAHVVTEVLSDTGESPTVIPVLCFIDGLIPAREKNRVARGVRLSTLKGIGELIARAGPLGPEQRFTVAATLHERLRPMQP